MVSETIDAGPIADRGGDAGLCWVQKGRETRPPLGRGDGTGRDGHGGDERCVEPTRLNAVGYHPVSPAAWVVAAPERRVRRGSLSLHIWMGRGI